MELAIKFFITFTEIALLFPLFVAYRNRAFWPNNLTLKLLAYFLLVSFIQICIVTPHDIINYNGYDSPNTVFYYNWQYVITAYLKLGIYYTLLTSKHKKFLILSFAVILTGFVVAEFRQDSLTFYNTGSFITNTYLVVNLLVITLSLIYAYQQLQDLSVENITKYPFFWLNAGFLVYHFGSIFVYSFVGNGANTEDATIAWIVNGLLLFILYITISFAYYYSYSPNLTQDS
jgi:hypothetical protein